MLGVGVVEINIALAGGQAANGHHPRRRRRARQRQQMPYQREAPEVVGAELQLESVIGLFASRGRHQTRVVDQNVDRPTLSDQLLPQRRDAAHRLARPNPRPLLAPVTAASRPDRSGTTSVRSLPLTM